MTLDVRMPIGTFFSLVGVLLTIYGAVTMHDPAASPTGVPIDLVWGLVLLAFGLVMVALARRARRQPGS
ncbi:MAG TPA: hypothetical protein VI139_03995 [Gemmatimonadales bacterium]